MRDMLIIGDGINGVGIARDVAGGDIGISEVAQAREVFEQRYLWLSESIVNRLFEACGTRAHLNLGGARSTEQLGRHFGADLYQAQVAYLRKYDFARCAQDVPGRATKLGLTMQKSQQTQLEIWFGEKIAA